MVPPQCFIKPNGAQNPYYACHKFFQNIHGSAKDIERQVYGYQNRNTVENHWHNLFVDRSRVINSIPDPWMETYVEEDNYSHLFEKLRRADWQGYLPDLDGLEFGKLAFDYQGIARDGSDWVTYNYKPLPSSFWHAKGFADDVMIRLPLIFRLDRQWQLFTDYLPAQSILAGTQYKTSPWIEIFPVEENQVAEDIDVDQNISGNPVSQLVPRKTYFGAASNIPVRPMLYPDGTEFMLFAAT